MRARDAAHPIEKVGSKLRAQMPFLDPVTVTADGQTGAPQVEEPIKA